MTVEIDSLTPPTEETKARTIEVGAKERQLNANGYTLKVAVYYDDMWKEEFKENAETRIDAIMALVDEQYSEDTFAVYSENFTTNPIICFMPISYTD